MKKALFLLSALCIILNICLFPVTADTVTPVVGEVDANYTPEGTPIRNASDFINMKADGSYYLACDITVNTTWNAAQAVNSLYSSNTAFTGTLDGNGKIITASAPLFANLQGTVKNLTVDGKIKYSKINSSNIAIWTSGTVIIDNVLTKANISGATSITCGAFIAYAANGSNVTITNSQNEAEIRQVGTAGGFIGYMQGNSLTIENCINRGTLLNIKYGAGIVGRFGRDAASAADTCAIFKNCVNYANVNGSGSYTAGILGYLVGSAIITDCVNYGGISNTANASAGIFGSTSEKENQCSLLIRNCVNYGKIEAPVVCGGIAACLGTAANHSDGYYRMENCINRGQIVSVISNKRTIPVYIGGLAGYAYGGGNVSNKIINSINAGDIVVKNSSTESDVFIAGLLAYVNSSSFEFKNNINLGKNSVSGNKPIARSLILYNKNQANDNVANNYSVAIDGVALALTGDPFASPSTLCEDTRAGVTVSADRIASGEVAYTINEIAGETIYYQLIGTDDAPVLAGAEDGSNIVLKNSDGSYFNPVAETDTEAESDADTESESPDGTTSLPETEVETEADMTTQPPLIDLIDELSASNGCSASLSGGIALIAILGTALLFKKKKR